MLADKGEDRHAVSRHMPIYAFMHLLVLGAFWLDFGDKAVAKGMRS